MPYRNEQLKTEIFIYQISNYLAAFTRCSSNAPITNIRIAESGSGIGTTTYSNWGMTSGVECDIVYLAFILSQQCPPKFVKSVY